MEVIYKIPKILPSFVQVLVLEAMRFVV